MSAQMVHGDEWFLRRKREAFCKIQAHQHRADEPGRKGDRHAANFIQRRARFVQRGPRHLRDMFDVAAACNLRHHAAVKILLCGAGGHAI